MSKSKPEIITLLVLGIILVLLGTFLVFNTPVHYTPYENYDSYEDSVTGEFVDPEGGIDLLIVKDKLLTGFDAPMASVL